MAPRMCSAFSQLSIVSVEICLPQNRQHIRDRMAEPAWVPIFSKSLVDFNLRQHISFNSCTRGKYPICTLSSKMTILFTDLSPFWLYCHKGHIYSHFITFSAIVILKLTDGLLSTSCWSCYSWDTNLMDEHFSYLFFNQILLFLAWIPYNEGNDSSILKFFETALVKA